MGGIPVLQPLPTQKVESIDPFLLLHHHVSELPKGAIPKKSGIGPHPHRGFSPVTFVFRGGVHHRDSFGNSAVVYEGGVQWVNAGRGMIHSERPPEDIFERGGVQEIIQLWINTPQKHKLDPPEYFNLEDNQIPRAGRGAVTVKVISGEFEGTRGPVNSKSPVTTLMISLKPGAKITVPVEEGYNSLFYAISGDFRVSNYGIIDSLNLVEFEMEGDKVEIEAFSYVEGIFLSGRPIGEPVVSYGPFVMTSQTEIMEAMRDYQKGKMGILIED